MNTNPDEPAFPLSDHASRYDTKGLSKLELFTLAAMQGLAQAYMHGAQINKEDIAEAAVAIARATLAALEQEAKPRSDTNEFLKVLMHDQWIIQGAKRNADLYRSLTFILENAQSKGGE